MGDHTLLASGLRFQIINNSPRLWKNMAPVGQYEEYNMQAYKVGWHYAKSYVGKKVSMFMSYTWQSKSITLGKLCSLRVLLEFQHLLKYMILLYVFGNTTKK